MYGGATPQLGVSAYTWVDNTWWKKQDPAAMIAELGGHGGAQAGQRGLADEGLEFVLGHDASR